MDPNAPDLYTIDWSASLTSPVLTRAHRFTEPDGCIFLDLKWAPGMGTNGAPALFAAANKNVAVLCTAS